MKQRNILFGGLLAATALIGTTGTVLAYQGDPAVKGPLYSAERHAAMTAAFQNNDYNAWKKLMEDRGQTRVTQVITKENFARFAEAHQLALEKKYKEAKKVRTELGLSLRNGAGMGQYKWQNR